MAWPADWVDGEYVTVARMNGWAAAIKTWGGDVDSAGYAVVLESSAPVDGEIPTRGVVIWINESTNVLTFRVRYSDGTTLKTGTIALA